MWYKLNVLPYSGKLSQISWFCGYKFSPQNLEVWHPLAQHKRAIRESFLLENCLFHRFTEIFSLKSFPLYDMYLYMHNIFLTCVHGTYIQYIYIYFFYFLCRLFESPSSVRLGMVSLIFHVVTELCHLWGRSNFIISQFTDASHVSCSGCFPHNGGQGSQTRSNHMHSQGADPLRGMYYYSNWL